MRHMYVAQWTERQHCRVPWRLQYCSDHKRCRPIAVAAVDAAVAAVAAAVAAAAAAAAALSFAGTTPLPPPPAPPPPPPPAAPPAVLDVLAVADAPEAAVPAAPPAPLPLPPPPPSRCKPPGALGVARSGLAWGKASGGGGAREAAVCGRPPASARRHSTRFGQSCGHVFAHILSVLSLRDIRSCMRSGRLTSCKVAKLGQAMAVTRSCLT